MNRWHALLPSTALLLALALSACTTPAGNGEVTTTANVPAGIVDYRCQADSDCAVKNVGNCCGYYPACVNTNSPTYPEQVRADCAREGKMAVCGFREISACSCNQGRCEATGSALTGGSQEVQ
jgi:predicted small secreted protein